MFLPEAFSTEPWAGSTTRTVDCWMGPRNLSWYLPCRLKELGSGWRPRVRFLKGSGHRQPPPPAGPAHRFHSLCAPAAVSSVEDDQVGLSVQGQPRHLPQLEGRPRPRPHLLQVEA